MYLAGQRVDDTWPATVVTHCAHVERFSSIFETSMLIP